MTTRTTAQSLVAAALSMHSDPAQAAFAPVTAYPRLSDFAVVHRTAPFPEPGPGAWLHPGATATDAPTLAVAQLDGAFLLRFPGLADFAYAPARLQIEVWPMPGANEETVRHLLLDQVLPRVLAHQGSLVLHAGAVAAEGMALAFTGPTGAGKSTLTASFQAAGYPLLSDDGLVVSLDPDAARVQATYPSLRLWPDALEGLFGDAVAVTPMAHYSSKRSVVLSQEVTYAGEPLPLAALFVLTPDAVPDSASDSVPTGVAIRRLSPADACMAIVANAFQLNLADRARVTGHVGQAAVLAQRVPVYTLAYAREFAGLPAVRAAILAQLADGPAAQSRSQHA